MSGWSHCLLSRHRRAGSSSGQFRSLIHLTRETWGDQGLGQGHTCTHTHTNTKRRPNKEDELRWNILWCSACTMHKLPLLKLCTAYQGHKRKHTTGCLLGVRWLKYVFLTLMSPERLRWRIKFFWALGKASLLKVIGNQLVGSTNQH